MSNRGMLPIIRDMIITLLQEQYHYYYLAFNFITVSGEIHRQRHKNTIQCGHITYIHKMYKSCETA